MLINFDSNTIIIHEIQRFKTLTANIISKIPVLGPLLSDFLQIPELSSCLSGGFLGGLLGGAGGSSPLSALAGLVPNIQLSSITGLDGLCQLLNSVLNLLCGILSAVNRLLGGLPLGK